MKFNYLLIIIVSLLAAACDNIPDDIVSTDDSTYQLVTLQAPTNFVRTEINTKFNTSIQIKNGSTANEVYLNVRLADGSDDVLSHIVLLDNGNVTTNGDYTANDNNFSAIVPMSNEFSSGNYIIEYFVNYNLGKQKIDQKVAVHQFSYNNGSANSAPVISDVIMPDSVTVAASDTVAMIISVAVSDSNGLSDISSVYFVTYRPNGTTSGDKFTLYDDGPNPDITKDHGDAVAGDGRYSTGISVTSNNAKGEYTFEFRARDKGSKLSNIIHHKILIK